MFRYGKTEFRATRKMRQNNDNHIDKSEFERIMQKNTATIKIQITTPT